MDGFRFKTARFQSILIMVSLLLFGCTTQTESSSGCLEPPADQVVETGVLVMEVTPNPVTAGAIVDLTTNDLRLPETQVVGEGLDFQCWNDGGWTPLFRLTRDAIGEPTAVAYAPGVTFVEPDLGINLPNQSRIRISEVPAGIYRLADAAVTTGREFPGFVYVEVVGS